IDTGSTLCAAAETLLAAGAKRLFAAATHAVFSGDALTRLAPLPFEQLVVTDTIPPPRSAPGNLVVLPCGDLLTDSIRRIFTDGSVSDVFGGENQLF
ncbi:MAG: ribose-phosphate diphosphokinase, partial [Actinobacteria bacterium]|nr:ribose-phosphate diphosphokinase [Actinomycetota bacterium]